ncbi:MAG: FlgO family outer membrane protein [Rhodanobacter sp.]
MGYMTPGMEYSPTKTLRIGDWSVHPASGQMSRGGESIRVEARTMRLLLCLAENAGEVVSIDDLLSEVWQGVIVTPDSVYQAVTSLRRLLGDDPKQPAYIATVPRRGYRMVATVDLRVDEPVMLPVAVPAVTDADIGPYRDEVLKEGSRPMMRALLLVVVVLLVGGFASYLLVRNRSTTQAVAASAQVVPNPRSIAVLPFVDMTDAMNEEPFADGMTDELIDKLSKFPGLQVSAPTDSFYFKGKQVTIADIAKSLHVAYVLDGSVRKSEATLRVSARLVRADDGFVVWSETYDRPWADKLMIQDDIASEVTKALKSSID